MKLAAAPCCVPSEITSSIFSDAKSFTSLDGLSRSINTANGASNIVKNSVIHGLNKSGGCKVEDTAFVSPPIFSSGVSGLPPAGGIRANSISGSFTGNNGKFSCLSPHLNSFYLAQNGSRLSNESLISTAAPTAAGSSVHVLNRIY